MLDLRKKINSAVDFIKSQSKTIPEIAIILGTGLGGLSKAVKNKKVISYTKIPHFPQITGIGHSGDLILGEIANKKVVVLSGRYHYYEGHNLEQITFPVRVIKHLGAKTLIVSNAAGGMNKFFAAGDIMIICDHINLTGLNPLIGPNDEKLGPRFPDMSEPYSRELIALTEKVAVDLKMPVKKGVYIGVTGPNLETAAEYRFFQIIGADAVGMSTVPEVIIGVHSGLKILGLSIITDMCLPDTLKPANIEEILHTASKAEIKLTKLVKKVIAKM